MVLGSEPSFSPVRLYSPPRYAPTHGHWSQYPQGPYTHAEHQPYGFRVGNHTMIGDATSPFALQAPSVYMAPPFMYSEPQSTSALLAPPIPPCIRNYWRNCSQPVHHPLRMRLSSLHHSLHQMITNSTRTCCGGWLQPSTYRQKMSQIPRMISQALCSLLWALCLPVRGNLGSVSLCSLITPLIHHMVNA